MSFSGPPIAPQELPSPGRRGPPREGRLGTARRLSTQAASGLGVHYPGPTRHVSQSPRSRGGDPSSCLSAASVSDYLGHQGVFYWGEPGSSSPAEVWNLLRAQGVSHIVWSSRTGLRNRHGGGRPVFFTLRRITRVSSELSAATLSPRFLDTPPPRVGPGEVADHPCDSDQPFVPGLLTRSISMARAPSDCRPVAAPIPGVSMAQAFERARFLVYDAGCHGPLPPAIRDGFELLAARGHSMMLERDSTLRPISAIRRRCACAGILSSASGNAALCTATARLSLGS